MARVKRVAAYTSLAAMVGFLGLTFGVAHAATAPESVSISRSGHVVLEGTVSSNSDQSMTVTSWGGPWSVNVASAKFIGRDGGQADISDFQDGDEVMIQGKIDPNSSLLVDAQSVRDDSIQHGVAISGTISNLNGNTFTLTAAKRTVQVTVNSDAKIKVNSKAGTISDIQDGMKAMVRGLYDQSQLTLAASMVNLRTVSK